MNQKFINALSLFSAVTATCAGSALMSQPARAEAPAPSKGGAITLAVHTVGLENSSGKTTLNKDTAAKVLKDVSAMYAQAGCDIQFLSESFTAVNPKDRGLEYNTSEMSELDKYRSAFDDGKSLLIVDTGSWSESMHPANAWTAMPGSSPMGAIFEASVSDFFQIVGHELGHYLGLDHVSDSSNMMNPVIGTESVHITADQCNSMKQTAQTALASARR